ncbi:unnamed protein product [Bemisia tabaci]|uniref:Uncharacterized protein n=1 Tax=Bemisia tabaci TaxID=7038 RepID=A0A9P0AHW3_BEMTA|nr:unnamed protein product [Bemisia tabaci]
MTSAPLSFIEILSKAVYRLETESNVSQQANRANVYGRRIRDKLAEANSFLLELKLALEHTAHGCGTPPRPTPPLHRLEHYWMPEWPNIGAHLHLVKRIRDEREEVSCDPGVFQQAEWEAEVERRCKGELLGDSCSETDESVEEFFLCEESMDVSSENGYGGGGSERSFGAFTDPLAGTEGDGGDDDGRPAEHPGVDGRGGGLHRRQGQGKAAQTSEKERLDTADDEPGLPDGLRAGSSFTGPGSSDNESDVNEWGCTELGDPGDRYVEAVYENSSGSRKEIINLWRARFGGSSSRRYVVHVVFRLGASYRNPEAVSKFLARLASGAFLVSIHGCHLHCVHVCRFANITCGCYITKHLRGRFGRWMARRNSQEREFSESRWCAIAIYLCCGRRRPVKISVQGLGW